MPFKSIAYVGENPELKDIAIRYFQDKWASDESKPVYEDCIFRSIVTENPLPIWYLLMDSAQPDTDIVIGCAGLITNDFISCMDLNIYAPVITHGAAARVYMSAR